MKKIRLNLNKPFRTFAVHDYMSFSYPKGKKFNKKCSNKAIKTQQKIAYVSGFLVYSKNNMKFRPSDVSFYHPVDPKQWISFWRRYRFG